MSNWNVTLDLANGYARTTGTRWCVRGFRERDGYWRYTFNQIVPMQKVRVR